MLRDTHIAAGVSAALLFTRPQGVLPAIGVVLSTVCGSVISDINADRSWARKQADVWICISAAGFAGAALVAAVSGQAFRSKRKKSERERKTRGNREMPAGTQPGWIHITPIEGRLYITPSGEWHAWL